MKTFLRPADFNLAQCETRFDISGLDHLMTLRKNTT